MALISLCAHQMACFTCILQLFDTTSSTYTYLLADTNAREAILIDPVYEHANRDFQLCKDLNLNLRYAGKFAEFFDGQKKGKGCWDACVRMEWAVMGASQFRYAIIRVDINHCR